MVNGKGSISDLEVAAVGSHELLVALPSLLSIQHHPPQSLIEVGIVEGQVVPRQLPAQRRECKVRRGNLEQTLSLAPQTRTDTERELCGIL